MQNQHTFWSVITSRLFLVVALVAVAGIAVGVVKSVLRRVEVEHEISALRSDIGTLQGKNDELSRLITYFQTPEFKEREARLQQGLQKPGEQVVVIPGLGAGAAAGAGNAAALSTDPNWRRWLNYFFSQE